MTKKSDFNNASPNKATLHERHGIGADFFLIIFGFLIGVALICLFLWQVETLVAFGLTEKFYYLILITLGIPVSAAFYKTLHSYARYSGQQLGGKLELGGPVVIFLLVIIMGFWFAPKTGNFPFTIYVHGKGGPQDLILRNTGYVMLDLGGERRREPIGDNGQVLFTEIPASFRGQTARIALDAYGYELIDSKPLVRLEGSSSYIAIRKKLGRIAGWVKDENGTILAGVNITIAGQSTTSDRHGYFEFTISGDGLRQEYPLEANAVGYSPWSGIAVPNANEVTILLVRDHSSPR